MKTSLIRALVLYSLLTAFVTGSSPAQDTLTVNIPAALDNTLVESPGGDLSNGIGTFFFVGRTGFINNTLRRGVLAFNVTDSIPAGSLIISAELKLHMSKTNSAASTVNMYRILSKWGEGSSDAAANEGGGAPSQPGDATWIHTLFDTDFWNTAGGDFFATPSASTSVNAIGFYSFGPTVQTAANVQLWLDDPDTSFGWILIGDEVTLGSAKRFDTRENITAANRPILTVSFVPPPCCIVNRGDANNDGNDANILDLTFLVNRIFRFGPAPACYREADVNSDGNSGNILDLNFLVNRIFRFGPAPGPC